MPSADTLRRLALIRYVYLMAVNQSRLPAPAHSFSVCTFQDAIETFLKLAMDVLGHASTKKDPDGFWFYVSTTNDLLAKRTPKPATLLHQSEIANINRARNDVKHNGLLVSASSVESCRVRATDFFVDNCPEIFGVPFAAISLALLIAPEKARVLVEAAESAMSADDNKSAVETAALAHEEIMRHFEAGLVARGVSDRDRDAHDFQHARAAMYITDKHTEQAISQLTTSTEKMFAGLHAESEAMRYGLDYMRSLRFKSIAPSVFRHGGQVHFDHRILSYERRHLSGRFSTEEAQFCVDYLIEIALTLQERLAGLPLLVAPDEG